MALLLIPGFMLDRDIWGDVEDALEERYGPVFHVDLSIDGSIREMARRAVQLVPEKFVVIGFSMGGYVAREIVRQIPDRVSALVLIATSARGGDMLQSKRVVSSAVERGAASFRGISSSAVKTALHPKNHSRADLLARIQSMGERLGGEVFVRQSNLVRSDERATLGDVRCPTLVIAGEHDMLRSNDEALEMVTGIASAELVTVSGVGHMVPLEDPQQLTEVILAWLDEVSLVGLSPTQR